MVEIRKLKPLVKIQLPTKPFDPLGGERHGWNRGASQQKIVLRRRVDFPPPSPQDTPCVLWQGVLDHDGYGVRWFTNDDGTRTKRRIYRWVVEESLGRRLKPAEVVLHACDNRLCFRLEHLSVGTVQDNNRDARLKGRASKPPRNVFFGEDHPNAKVTWAKVEKMRTLHRLGVSNESLAASFGLSVGAVGRITSNRSWKTKPEGWDEQW